MKKTLLGLLISATLCGCSMFEEEQNNTAATNRSAPSEPLESSLAFQNQFSNRFYTPHRNNDITANGISNSGMNDTSDPQTDGKLKTNQKPEIQHDINYYVRGLMQDLIANLQYVNATTPVAVVSFVMLDSDYNDANILGIQIAESLIHEVHKFGIPVIDFKTTGFIRVTEQGDFAFSKDYQDFSGEMPARYIVGGTMLKHTDGYLINARIVGVKSQAVVATAQSFIPNEVSEQILTMNTDSQHATRTVDLSKLTDGAFFPSSNVSLSVEKIPGSKNADTMSRNTTAKNVTLIQD